MDTFLRDLSILHRRTNAVAKLRSGVLAKRIAESDEDTSELQARVFLLMGRVEHSFRIIRRKLLS